MARRNDNTREELKQMAIASGVKILDEKGLDGLSARKVTSAMGYTIGTLYQVFNNYDDLILHVRGVVLDDLQQLLSDAIKHNHTSHKKIRTLAMAYLAFAKQSHSRWHILFSNDKPDTVLPEWYQLKLKMLFSVIEQTLLPLLNNNMQRAQDEAKILWAGVHGICVLSISQKLGRVGSQPAEELIDRFLKNYLRTLSADIKS
jgi:AcrR family transcriptional regulator